MIWRVSSAEEERPLLLRLQLFLQHHWLTLAFVGGFITDFLLLNRVDDTVDNTILTAYVCLATVSLLIFYAAIARRFGERLSPVVERYAGALMQYAYGGLFSGMFIFYSKSGALLASWPFLLLIAAAILGNELIKNRGQKLVFNLFSYFVGVFSFAVLQVPVLTGQMGPGIFVASGAGALVLVYGVVQLLRYIIPNYLALEMRKIVFTLLGTFTLFMGLYFMNIIPPIPLSLQAITIAQSVVKVGNEYEVVYEPAPWWQVWQRVHATFHPATGSVACFTRVFAPTKLTTDIQHVWEYRDAVTGQWKHHFSLPFPIIGGGENGYRGFTAISSYHDGVWRCRVETTRGQVIGQQVFTIDSTVAPATTRRVVE